MRSRWEGPRWAPAGGPLSAAEVERLNAGLSLEPAGLLVRGGEAWCATCVRKCFAQLGLRLWRAERADGRSVCGVRFRCLECGAEFDGMWLLRHDPDGAGELLARTFYEFGAPAPEEDDEDDMGLDRFFTNPKLADAITEWAGLTPELAHEHDNYRILEPSAGDGSFVRAVLTRSKARVVAIDIDPELCKKLQKLGEELGAGDRLKVICSDFLKSPLPKEGAPKLFDLVLMNPPYGSRAEGTVGLAARHAAHALAVSRRLVGLFPSSIEHGARHERDLWSKATPRGRVVLVNRPEFGGPDDKGEGPRRDHVVIEIEPNVGQRPDVFAVSTERWEIGESGERLR